MMKAAIDRRKQDAELQRNVILNALINYERKKSRHGARLIELFPKEKERKTTETILKEREELFGDSAAEMLKKLTMPD